MSKELPRDSRSFMWLEDLRRDVAYGVRTLLRAPGFTLVAVLTLALGISAVTVIYSVLRNVALDPFPYSRSDRLVNVVLRDGSGRIIRGPYFRSEEFLDYQEQTTAFEDVVGTSQFSAHWMSDAGAERLALNWMTPNGFDFLGVPPLIGRVFDYRDVAPGAPPVAVMNHRAWVTRFGADRGVIGRTLVLDGQPYTVIGVMPPRFEWNIADLWLPAAMQRGDDPQSPRGARAFQAHLRPGVTAAEAEAQLNVIGARRAGRAAERLPARFPLRHHSRRRLGGARVPRHALCALRRGQPPARHRLLQRRQYAAGARDDPRARNHDSRGDRRQPRPHRPAVARRECGARVRRARRRMPDGVRRHRRARRLHAAAGRALGDADQARSAGAPVRARGRSGGDDRLRSLPGAAERAAGRRPRRQHHGALDRWPAADAHARRPGRRPGGALDGAAARRRIADADVRQAGERGPGVGSEERAGRRHRVPAPRTDVPRGAAAVLPGGGRTDWVHAGCLGRCTDERHAAFRRLLEPIGDSRICRAAAVGSTGHLCERAAARDGRNTRAAGARAVRPGGGEDNTSWRWSTKHSRKGTSAERRSDVPCGCRPSRRCRCRLPIPLSSS